MRRILHSLALLLVIVVSAPRAEAAKEKFDRSKPHVNVGTIGHVDHGETTLAAAIIRVLASLGAPTFPPLANWPSPQGGRKRICDVRYETADRIYRHFDCGGRDNFVRDWISGATPIDDGAILVVSAADGPMPQTREHILLARQVGVPALVVFIDEIDLVDDPLLLELVEMEVRELLRVYEYPAELTPFVFGDIEGAQAGDPRHVAAILQLVEEMDLIIPLPIPLDEKPFLMPVEDVFSIRGRGAVASGRVERGIVEEGDPVEIVGLGARIPSVVSGIRGKMSQGTPGDKIGVLLRGVDKSDVQRGQVLARPGSVAPHKKFKAEVYVLKKGNGGREQPFFKGYKPQFYFRTTDVTGEIDLPDGTEIVVPGDHLEMSVELLTELALEEGLRFAIGDPKHRVGVGIVTEIVE